MARLEQSVGHEADTDLRLIYAIGRFHTALRAELSHALKANDMTVPEFTALSVLDHRAGLSNAQLARRCFVTPQAMNQVLASLEDKGLVRRRDAPGGDGRVHHRARGTQLTAQGRALVRRNDELVDRIESTAFVGLAESERAELSTMLLAATERLRASDGGLI